MKNNKDRIDMILLSLCLIPWAAALIYGAYSAAVGFDKMQWFLSGTAHGAWAFLWSVLYLEIKFMPVFIVSLVFLFVWLMRYTKRKRDQLL